MADLRAIEQQNRNRELDPNIPQPEKPSFMGQLFFPNQGRPAGTGMFDDLLPQNKGAAMPRPLSLHRQRPRSHKPRKRQQNRPPFLQVFLALIQ